jgi:outer membrane murein-binding lipoprotein Lpp
MTAASTPEDERAAASIYTSLSSYLITASLGVIAAQAALATFVLDKRDHLFWFYVWMVSGLIASVVSIVLGGRGIADIASEGFEGEWTLKPKGGDLFNYQAICCLLGMVLLLFSLFSGSTKAESPALTQQIQQLNDTVQKLQTEVDSLRTQVQKMSEEKNTSAPVSPPKRRPAPSKKAHK